jgi:hypothetical protein
MMAKLHEGPDRLRAWAATARRSHEEGTSDPIWRRVDHLVLLIVHIMQSGVRTKGDVLLQRGPDEKLSLREVASFRRNPYSPLGEVELDAERLAHSHLSASTARLRNGGRANKPKATMAAGVRRVSSALLTRK